MNKIKNWFVCAGMLLSICSTVYPTGTWVEQYPTGSIGDRSRHSMAFDSTRNRVYVYGGTNSSKAFALKTWYYDGSLWTMENTLDASDPPGRTFQAMVYIPTIDRLFMFGGNSGAYLNDSWYFNANTPPAIPEWTQINTTICSILPSGRMGHGMVYDSTNNKVIVFGGLGQSSSYKNDIWVFDPAVDPATICPWTEIVPVKEDADNRAQPVVRAYHGMVYDASNQLVVIYGGRGSSGTPLSDTWTFNPATNQFTQLNCGIHTPGTLEKFVMSYDSGIGAVMLFGGGNPSAQDQTWELDQGIPAWTEMELLIHPQARLESSIAYDSARTCHVMYAGLSAASTRLSDTWEYTMLMTPSSTATPPPLPSTSPTGQLSLLLVFGCLISVIMFHRSRSRNQKQ